MALHEQSVGATDEWYTPPHIFRALDCGLGALLQPIKVKAS